MSQASDPVAVAPVVEARDDLLQLARIFLESHRDLEGLTFRFHRGEWSRWVDSAWRSAAAEAINTTLTGFCKAELPRPFA
jgi:hypothetical protein